MTGAEQAALAIRLDQALAAAGLRITRARLVRGNVRAWEPLDAASILGRLAAFGWRVEAVEATPVVVLRLETPA